MPKAQGCCGGLDHHAGRERAALAAVRANVDAWLAEAEGQGLDAILITASGCGTTVKDYGHMLRTDAAYAGKAARVSKLTLDISEYLSRLKIAPAAQSPASPSRITPPVRCSMDRKSCVHRKNCFPILVSWSKMYQNRICVAVRPVRTTFSNRSLRTGCVSAKSRISRRSSPT